MHPLRLPFATVVAVISAFACVSAWTAAPLYSPAEVRAAASTGPAEGTEYPPADSHGWKAPAAPSAARAVAYYPNGSVVVEQRFWSAALAREMHYRLYLPPGYVLEWRDYPVLYMLHGVAGGSSEWEELGLLEAADRLIAAGEIAPLLIVLPDGGPNYWVDHADGARWRDFVVSDIVPNVGRLYRTHPVRAARAIGGLSMGGEGALRIALLHPDIFGIAAAHAPSLRTS
ncbi:MAG: esterase family protein [Chloroflexota bacterium]|nr:esterase family protein [Chloroflexota bacterium]